MPPWLQMIVYTFGIVGLILPPLSRAADGIGPFVVVVAWIVAYFKAQISLSIVPFPGIILILV